MKPSINILRFALAGCFIFVTLVVVVIVGPLKRVGEFGRAESCKGYWASLQDFVKEKGRYPKGDAEIAAFFHTAPNTEPVEYVSPQNDGADEVVLWWKQKTMFGVKVGITESGMIVKR